MRHEVNMKLNRGKMGVAEFDFLTKLEPPFGTTIKTYPWKWRKERLRDLQTTRYQTTDFGNSQSDFFEVKIAQMWGFPLGGIYMGFWGYLIPSSSSKSLIAARSIKYAPPPSPFKWLGS